MTDQLVIAGRAFKSRLIVGTGKYRSFQEMARAHAASAAPIWSRSPCSASISLNRSKESLLDYHRSRENFYFAEHRRMLFGGRSGTARPGSEGKSDCRNG